jgi:hypothetical protein
MFLFSVVADTIQSDQSIGILLLIIVLLRHRAAMSDMSNEEAADPQAHQVPWRFAIDWPQDFLEYSL